MGYLAGINSLHTLFAQSAGQWVLLVLSLFPLFKMARTHLKRPWLLLLLAFCALLGLSYVPVDPSGWAGVSALWAVFGGWFYLQNRYAGASGTGALLFCSVCTVVTLGLSAATGLGLVLGLLLFSGLHCFLHEREERSIGYGAVSRRVVLMRWARSWGLSWGLPLTLLVLWGLGAGRFPQGGFLPQGYRAGLPWGYFSSFHQEFMAVWLGQGAGGQGAFRGDLFQGDLVWAILKSSGLLLIGLLPLVGILGGGYQIPGRFVYRLLQRPDEELLLFWLCGLSLIVATGAHSSSGAIVANGFLAFLLALWVLAGWCARRLTLARLG